MNETETDIFEELTPPQIPVHSSFGIGGFNYESEIDVTRFQIRSRLGGKRAKPSMPKMPWD